MCLSGVTTTRNCREPELVAWASKRHVSGSGFRNVTGFRTGGRHAGLGAATYLEIEDRRAARAVTERAPNPARTTMMAPNGAVWAGGRP